MSEVDEQLQSALADRYTIEREIGSGGMATVYLARDEKLGRDVALKVLRPELAASLGPERFLREIEIAAKLRHPNIVVLHDYGSTAARQDGSELDFLYYVMPYVEGESLRDRLDRETQLSIDDALQITREVADALGHAHSLGIVHRDIRPENILFTAGHAVVSDFGIARAVTESGGEKLTETGMTIGTPGYMSPEQGAGSGGVDARSDIYSLGCVLYEMLSGDAPYTASTPQAVLAKKQSEPIPRISVVRETVPPGVEATITKALAKNPADRFVTAQQFVEALDTPSFESEPVAARRRKRPAWHWVAGLVAVVAIVAIGAVLSDRWRSRTDTAVADDIDRLVVAPLENRTGDSAAADWGFMAAEYVTRALDQAAVVTVVPASVVRDLVRDVDSAVGMSLDEIARRTEARYAVTGSYSTSGGSLRFDVELVNTESGELERSLDPVNGPVDSLQAVFTLLAEQITAATVTRLSPDLSYQFRRVFRNPPTLEAVRGLLVLQDHFCGADWRSTIEEAQRVLQETPDFAFPLLMLAYSYANTDRPRQADSVLTLLAPLSDQLSRRERLLGDRLRAGLAGDHDAATLAAEQLHRMYPSMHAVGIAVQTNRFADAVERFRALDLDAPCNRRMPLLWTTVARAYQGLGRYQEELDVVRDGLERFRSYRALLLFEAFALAGQGRLEAVDSLLDVMTDLLSERTSAGSFFNTGSYTAMVALELDFLGRPEASKRVMDRALAWFAALPADTLRGERGQALYWAERWYDADTLFAALLERVPDNFPVERLLVPRGHRGVALAHLGRHDEALEVERWLAQLDRPYLLGRNTRWRAAIHAALGDREEAVRLLRQAYSEGMTLGTAQRREPEWRTLRDYGPYQEFVRPR